MSSGIRRCEMADNKNLSSYLFTVEIDELFRWYKETLLEDKT